MYFWRPSSVIQFPLKKRQYEEHAKDYAFKMKHGFREQVYYYSTDINNEHRLIVTGKLDYG